MLYKIFLISSCKCWQFTIFTIDFPSGLCNCARVNLTRDSVVSRVTSVDMWSADSLYPSWGIEVLCEIRRATGVCEQVKLLEEYWWVFFKVGSKAKFSNLLILQTSSIQHFMRHTPFGDSYFFNFYALLGTPLLFYFVFLSIFNVCTCACKCDCPNKYYYYYYYKSRHWDSPSLSPAHLTLTLSPSCSMINLSESHFVLDEYALVLYWIEPPCFSSFPVFPLAVKKWLIITFKVSVDRTW